MLGLQNLLHFLPNQAFILTARAVTIDKNECPILRRRAAALKSNRAPQSKQKEFSGPIHLSPKTPSALDTDENPFLSLVVSPELGDIYCSDYSFTIKTRCSYPTTERKSDFETKTKTLLSIIQIDKVRSNNREQDLALKRADCCFGALKVVLRLGCAFTPFGKPGQRTYRKKTTSSRCHALRTLHLSMSIDRDRRVVRQTGG